MRLLDVHTKSGYLVIETDEGPRKQSLNWSGVDRLHKKALSLIGKEIVTTTLGDWNPCVWFATLDAARPVPAAEGLVASSHDAPGRAQPAEEGSTNRLPSSSRRCFDHVFKVYGPPGTGKTTFLIERVREALDSGVKPDEIGFFSYTNKATEEAKSRMVKAFPQFGVETDFPYFQTLHSLAVQSLRTRVVVITDSQAREFDFAVTIDRPLMKEGDESSQVVRVKHPVLDASSTARALRVPLHEYLAEMPRGQLWPINKWRGVPKRLWERQLSQSDIRACLEYNESYERYKNRLGVIDYTDMLERALTDHAALPRLKLLLIDEAQDLNPLQWDMARILIDRSERCYVAGDDDQAICESFGASARHFVDLPVAPGNEIVLPESRRVPPAVLEALEPLIARLDDTFPYRKTKTWAPRTGADPGKVGEFDSLDKFLASPALRGAIARRKSVLMMFATNATLLKLSGLLKQKGISHYAANRLEGAGTPNIRLLTVWGAKGGEAEVTALIVESDIDRKMLSDDPRLEYVAHTRALEEYYRVDHRPESFGSPQATQPTRCESGPASAGTGTQPSQAALDRLVQKYGQRAVTRARHSN